MTRASIVATLMAALILPLSPASADTERVAYRPQSCASAAQNGSAARQVLEHVNAQRRSQGLSPVRLSGRLDKVAQMHACDMASQGRYTHVGSDGSDLSQRLRRGGYKFRLGAENTARGFDSSSRVVNFWMNSTYHRANILQARATEMGVGVIQPVGDRPYWVLVLAAPRR